MKILINKEKILNLLGLAYRAKKIVNGEENVLKALKSGKCKIVFVANDASENTIDKFDKKCYFYQVEMNNDFSTEELSKCIGRSLVKIMTLTDQGFYKSLNELLK